MPPTEALPIAVKRRFLREYWAHAPLPLALERTWECTLLARQHFVRPVLDIGCGEGLFARILFGEAIDTGIDPNARELERAHGLGAYRELLTCGGNAIPKPAGAYRTIFANSVLEHIPDLDPVLREMYRLLAPGGRVYVTVPSHRYDHYTLANQLLAGCGLKTVAERYRAFFNRFWRHYHFHDPAGWQARFARHGFEVHECHTYGPKTLCLLNDMLVPFCLPNMILKRICNRWMLLPGVRRLVLAPLELVGESIARRGTRAEDGGLVFLVLGKRAASATLAQAG